MKIIQIDLTQEEQKQYNQIHFSAQGHTQSTDEDFKASSNAAASLTLSLLNRKAIPEIRIRYFVDPTSNIRTKMSHKEIFEKNGTFGEDIFKHRHFLPYLHYFIFGPDLPKETINAFSQIVRAEPFISGSDMPGLRKFVQSETRKFRLNPKNADEEFYKLALEWGIDKDLARMIGHDVRICR
jgi:hypothetical protein